MGIDERGVASQGDRCRVQRRRGLGHARAPTQVVQQRLAVEARHLLGQVADGQGGGCAVDGAGVGRFQPGEHAQQRGLPDPVGPNDADAGARPDDDGHIGEHRVGAVDDGDVDGGKRAGDGTTHECS